MCKSAHSGFDVDSAAAVLKECCVSACGGAGVAVSGIGGRARADVEGCTLEHNTGCGILAGRNSMAKVTRCCSRGNGEGGYKARWSGARMVVMHGSSDGDGGGGCAASDGGSATLQGVAVDGVLKSCTLV